MNETKNWMLETIITIIMFILSIFLIIGDHTFGGFTFFIISYLLKEVIMMCVRQMDKLKDKLEEL